MKYQRTIAELLTESARIFPTESEALIHLFFTSGNGYRWHKGQLVREATKREREQWAEERRLARIEALGYEPPEETVEQQRQSYYDRLKWAYSRGYPGVKKLPDGRFAVQHELCEYDLIQSVPADVKPDWLEAARKAVAVMESDEVMIREEHRPLLEAAKRRVGL